MPWRYNAATEDYEWGDEGPGGVAAPVVEPPESYYALAPQVMAPRSALEMTAGGPRPPAYESIEPMPPEPQAAYFGGGGVERNIQPIYELSPKGESESPFPQGGNLEMRLPDISRTAPSTQFAPEFVDAGYRAQPRRLRPPERTALSEGLRAAFTADPNAPATPEEEALRVAEKFAEFTSPPQPGEPGYQPNQSEAVQRAPFIGGLTSGLSKAAQTIAPAPAWNDPLGIAMSAVPGASGVKIGTQFLGRELPGVVKLGMNLAGADIAEGAQAAGRAVREGAEALPGAARRFAADEAGAVRLPGGGGDEVVKQPWEMTQAEAVAQASAVPPEVLADYPDLKAGAGAGEPLRPSPPDSGMSAAGAPPASVAPDVPGEPPRPPEPPTGLGAGDVIPTEPLPIGSVAPDGTIVGAQPPPPASVPPVGGPGAIPPSGTLPPVGQAALPPGSLVSGTPSPPRQIWARPLDNAAMVAGAFKDNIYRHVAELPLLKQAMSKIDPAALVSGTATDAVSLVKRGMLLRNRVLDVGDSAVNAGMALLKERKMPFSIDRKGNIAGLPPGSHWEDVFSAPTLRGLTPEQLDYIRLYQEMVEDGKRLLLENGVTLKELNLPEGRDYIPRVVKEIRGIENERALGKPGGRVGTKPGYQKTRFYDWAQEGVDRGVVYSENPLGVLEHHVQGIYKQIADQRLGEIVNPLGQTITERMPAAVIKAAADAKKTYDRAKLLMAAVNHSYRGERLSPATIASIARDFPNEAALLKASGPNNPALQQVEALARQAMADSKMRYATTMSNRARAHDVAAAMGFDEAYIPQPFAGGRIFPKEVAETVNQQLGDQGNAWLREATKIGGLSRTAATAWDVGAPMVQGLPVLGRHPALWAKATLMHYAAIVRPEIRQAYFARNQDILKEMAQYGVNIGGSEMLGGGKPVEGLLKKLPGPVQDVTTFIGKHTLGRLEEAYGTFLDVAGVELWKAARARAAKDGPDSFFALADVVNHTRGTMSQRTIGVGPTQQQVESTFMMFAPRYTKAGFALVADALQGGVKGEEARKSLVGLAAAGTGIFLSGALAKMATGEMSAQDVRERLTPIKNGRYNSKFMTLPFGTDNVGFGGFQYSLLRLIAGGTDKALNEPGDLVKWDARDNPLLQFATGRLVGSAPLSSLALELGTGTTWQGEKLTTPLDYGKAVARRLMPFWAEAYLLQEPQQSGEAFAPSFSGFRVFPESYGARAEKLKEQLGGQRGLTLPLNRAEQRQVEAESPELQALRKKAEEQNAKRVKTKIQSETEAFYNELDSAKGERERDLTTDYRSFIEGKIDGKMLRERRSTAMTKFAGAVDGAKRSHPEALTDRISREAFSLKERIDLKDAAPEDIAAEGYYMMEPPDDETGGADFTKFFAGRDNYLKQFDAKTQDYILRKYPNHRFEQPWMNEIEQRIQKAQETLRPYWDVKAEVEKQFPDAAQRFKDAVIERKRQIIKAQNPAVRDALTTWYKPSPVTAPPAPATSPVAAPPPPVAPGLGRSGALSVR